MGRGHPVWPLRAWPASLTLGWLPPHSSCLPTFLPQNPAVADIYTEHAHQVVVAKYAPSGFYVASGGNV